MRDSCDPGGDRMARGWRFTKLSLSIAFLVLCACFMFASCIRLFCFMGSLRVSASSLPFTEFDFVFFRPSFMGIGFGSGILLDFFVLFADRIVAEPKSNRSILWDMEVCNDLNGVFATI